MNLELDFGGKYISTFLLVLLLYNFSLPDSFISCENVSNKPNFIEIGGEEPKLIIINNYQIFFCDIIIIIIETF